MELRLKPYYKNSFPIEGVLIKESCVEHWVKEIQWMGLALSDITVFPIPGTRANTIWGCLVIFDGETNKINIGRNVFCQLVNNILFIPERAILYPRISHSELEQLFSGKRHIFHPEFGLAALEDVVDWSLIIKLPKERTYKISKPQSSLFIPKQIKSFQIKPVTPEEVLESFEEKHFPKPEPFKEKPLNLIEKAKLFFYRQLFSKNTGSDQYGGPEKTTILKWLESIRKLLSGNQDKWSEKLQMDFEELERRNQKHLDRLLDLIKKNPREALKYAIPLDTSGTARGSLKGAFDWQKRWQDFSIFGKGWNSGNAGSAILPGNSFDQLHSQYWNTAQELVKQKDYQTAAFVYMKLLKNYPMAAQTLEQGGFYSEAASVYLKYSNNKIKAAECFEKGNMVSSAIELYKELNQNEKVGDLYYSIQKKPEAFQYYQKVADNYLQVHQFLKAALLYKNKMENMDSAQDVLIQGWRANRDAFNCLNNYFSNIGDAKEIWNEINLIYQNEVNTGNLETFLKVLKYEHDKQLDFSQPIKDLAYQIIVEQIPTNPSIVTELRSFNKEDKNLIKDTLRFKLKFRKT